MPETTIIALNVQTPPEVEKAVKQAKTLFLDGWLPDKFYGENGINTIDNVIFRHFIRYSEEEKQEILNNHKNAEVLLEPNPNSTEETYKIIAVFNGKTIIFENCKPKKT
jgi:hypothetical protein